MKINTITCHRVFNHGASLQQLALLHHLQSLGHNVQTINYQPNYLADHYRYTGVPSPKFKNNVIFRLLYIVAKFPERLNNRKRREAFDAFEKKYIPQTKKLYRTNEQLKDNLPEADAYICGSDQIWNTLFENGKDPAFYLDFVPNNKLKISYAASFATENINNDIKNFVEEKVKAIDCISVRESSGLKILENLGIENVTHVTDPVFLLSKEDWEKKFITKEIENKHYILVYDFDNNPLIKEYALYLKEKKGFEIVALSPKIKYADRYYWSIGPDKFLNLLHKSSFVLANSFHATAFSFIFEKQCLIFNRNTGINTRMRDFLQEYGLLKRMVLDFNENIIDDIIDYSEIKPQLQKNILKSKSFLNQSLQHEKLDNK